MPHYTPSGCHIIDLKVMEAPQTRPAGDIAEKCAEWSRRYWCKIDLPYPMPLNRPAGVTSLLLK